MPKTDSITQSRLKELLHYDPETGLFTRLINAGKRGKAGDIAGTKKRNGYIGIKIDGVTYQAHRLACLYMIGWMPVEVDHDDQVRHNNRWKNLNPATRTKNMKNKKLYCTNTSGHVGVYRRNKKWLARTTVNKKDIHIGSFTCKADAIAARQAADIEHGFHKNHGAAA